MEKGRVRILAAIGILALVVDSDAVEKLARILRKHKFQGMRLRDPGVMRLEGQADPNIAMALIEAFGKHNVAAVEVDAEFDHMTIWARGIGHGVDHATLGDLIVADPNEQTPFDLLRKHVAEIRERMLSSLSGRDMAAKKATAAELHNITVKKLNAACDELARAV